MTYAAASQFAPGWSRKGCWSAVMTRVTGGGLPSAERAGALQVVGQAARLARERLRAILARMPEEKRLALLDGLEAFLFHAWEDAAAIERLCGRCRIPHSPRCVVNRMAWRGPGAA